MSLFRRTIRFVLAGTAVLMAVLSAIALFVARLITAPPREKVWATPSDLGLAFEPIEFPARDDAVRLSGWFVPVKVGLAPTVVVVHGWLWNRLGSTGEGFVANVTHGGKVDLLRLTQALHRAGYHVVQYDGRNHGQSASHGPVTFGYMEANDLLGCLDYLAKRPDVDQHGLGVVGFSMGANTALYALARTTAVRAAVLVQPTSIAHFQQRFTRYMVGPLARPLNALIHFFVQRLGGVPLHALDPLTIAPATGHTPLLFIQGEGDPWGSVDNVAHIAMEAPGTVATLWVDAKDRFAGYQYPIEHPELITSFLGDYLK